MGSSIWFNNGNRTVPHWERNWSPEAEFYLYSAHYGTGTSVFNGTYCNETLGLTLEKGNCNSLIHTFVAVLVPEEYYNTTEGIPSYGLHYSQDTTCPEKCGAKPCDCDALLVDLLMEGTLGFDWDGNNFYLPEWAQHFATVEGSQPNYALCAPN